jgi:hypothetical protein
LQRLAALGNGVWLMGVCGATDVGVVVLPTLGGGLDVSGTANSDSTVRPVDLTTPAYGNVGLGGTATADFDVVANNTSMGPFAHIDLHGTYGSPCTFWWMAVPSS